MTLYNLMQWSQTALDNYVIPEGVDRDTLNSTILMRCAQLKLVWDTPGEAEFAINTWFKANLTRFSRLWRTQHVDYNPLDNMDVQITANGQATSTASSDTENKVSAYNASIYSPDSESGTSSSATSATHSGQHKSGLSGMYSYQDLVGKERAISDWSFYEEIAKKFEYAHCISVY